MMKITRRLSGQQLMIVLAIVVGLVSGFAAYAFEWLLHLIRHSLVSWIPADTAGYLFLVYPAVGIILASLFVKHIVKDNISEGVTRVLYAISKTGSRIRGHNCYTSMVGGAVTIGFGGSVGPEAPIVLTGSAIGSNIAQVFRLNYRDTTLLLGCGAAGALAAIFKAPVTGLIFVLEVLMLDISMRAIVPLLISSVVSTTLVLFLKGFDPMLNVSVGGTFNLQHLHMYVVLAVLCGLVSFYFLTVNGKVQKFFGNMRKQSTRWIVGGVAIGLLIFLFPPLYGEGYESFIDLMHGQVEPLFNNSLFYQYRDIPWVVVLFLLVNVFLGLIGTFWFRTRRRRSEIALRMAMGSTRGGVFRLLIGEGLLLLALVTLPAMVVCYNVGMAEFTIGRTSLISTWPIEWSVIRFLAGSLGAWLLIALMVVIGIWFPARQAMKIEPAEALHEE